MRQETVAVARSLSSISITLTCELVADGQMRIRNVRRSQTKTLSEESVGKVLPNNLLHEYPFAPFPDVAGHAFLLRAAGP